MQERQVTIKINGISDYKRLIKIPGITLPVEMLEVDMAFIEESELDLLVDILNNITVRKNGGIAIDPVSEKTAKSASETKIKKTVSMGSMTDESFATARECMVYMFGVEESRITKGVVSRFNKVFVEEGAIENKSNIYVPVSGFKDVIVYKDNAPRFKIAFVKKIFIERKITFSMLERLI